MENFILLIIFKKGLTFPWGLYPNAKVLIQKYTAISATIISTFFQRN